VTVDNLESSGSVDAQVLPRANSQVREEGPAISRGLSVSTGNS